jgi:exonuclease III
MEDTPPTEEEAFHTSYQIFIDALRMLTLEASEQCAAMGDYNVAWELKDDAQSGKYLLHRGHLNAEQEAWIGTLVCAMENVPTQTLPAGSGREINLQTMQHPSWIPLRVIAKHVLDALAVSTKTNAKFLGLP